MKIPTLFFFVLITSTCFSQYLSKEIEKHSIAVCYIHSEKNETVVKNGEQFEVWLKNKQNGDLQASKNIDFGSGFFIHSEDRYSTYLVTAAHVAIKTNNETQLVVSGPEGKSSVIKLIDIAFLNKIDWIYNSISDVAVLPLNPQYLIDNSSTLGSMSVTYLDHKYIPNRTREVTCVGFPLQIGFRNNFSPITKSSRPSSGFIEINDPERNQMREYFLLEDPSTPGFSGSPVFEFPSQVIDKDRILLLNNTSIVGLVHGFVSNNSVINSGGFAAVVPVKYIINTISSAPKYSGTLVYKYHDDKPWSEIEIKNGVPIRILYNLDRNGLPKDKGTLQNGNGTIKMYLDNGDLGEIRTYENGKIIKYSK